MRGYYSLANNSSKIRNVFPILFEAVAARLHGVLGRHLDEHLTGLGVLLRHATDGSQVHLCAEQGKRRVSRENRYKYDAYTCKLQMFLIACYTGSV